MSVVQLPLPGPALTTFRPLPDERRGQSVANLIGRFEQQGKRQASPAVPLVPRSSSVSSQMAGDAAKEEAKEKREWPPKAADIKPVLSTVLSAAPPSMFKPPVATSQPIPDPAPSMDVSKTPTPASPEPVKSPPSKGKFVAAGKSTSAARRSATTPAKSRPSTGNNSSPRPSTSSPPKTSLQSSVSQPLRPQHTGQSVISNPSTTRQARPVPRTAPSTPSRPKSSAAHNQPVTRPKTPSSGLFAPTAASLARSRNAPPPPPPPVRKLTLSSDAAERLSKPTAASLSKARTPVTPAASIARVVKSTSTGPQGPTPRGPSSKLKAGRVTAEPGVADGKEETQLGPASASSEPSRDSDHPVADHAENGHELGIAARSNVGSPEETLGHPEVAGDVAHGPLADQEVHLDSDPEQHPVERPAEEEVHGLDEHVENPPEEVAAEPEQVHVEPHEVSAPEPVESHASEVISNGLKVGLVPSGNDIEDIVNLLEGSKPRPQSIVSIPDENPDEY